MPKYELPELPYGYSALEPHLSGEILELHHDKHHAAYVAGANAAIDKLAELREKCRSLLPTAPFVVTATAWAARGHA